MKLSDFKGLFKKNKVAFESVENPYDDYYKIKLKKPSDLTWTPGEHAIFRLSNKNFKGRKWRVFSVASIPEEGFLLIGTKTDKNISNFKKSLISMRKGEEITVIGPFGWYKLKDDTSPVIFISTGVGITPVRSILKELEFKPKRDTYIIYASKNYYLFGEELETIVQNHPSIKLYKTNHRDETHKKIKELSNQYKNNAYYYLSGSPDSIKGNKEFLKSQNIAGRQIINDPFFGY